MKVGCPSTNLSNNNVTLVSDAPNIFSPASAVFFTFSPSTKRKMSSTQIRPLASAGPPGASSLTSSRPDVSRRIIPIPACCGITVAELELAPSATGTANRVVAVSMGAADIVVDRMLLFARIGSEHMGVDVIPEDVIPDDVIEDDRIGFDRIGSEKIVPIDSLTSYVSPPTRSSAEQASTNFPNGALPKGSA
eukprot:CAMPEP_0181318020 /NCGR_PEP_ID=MMETSP1101-20121128/16782_1 /TAXON_ID=46948 /ORGANISM="Rhodomonas abbreviata, Strain Caron Lab Isolate" /LENGTH=191 /DNA_ID=CAMNT_0023425459 /DNA_START=157 /DNA_END=729 /DNA_ORIENTATION=-